jgi:hypothetical protein
VQKRGNRQVPVGTLIFDPDGEYFWPDTYAAGLRERFDREVKELLAKTPVQPTEGPANAPDPVSIDEPETVDVLSL